MSCAKVDRSLKPMIGSTLENSGWSLDVKAYNALVDGFCKGGMVVLSEMVGKCILPNVVTYSSIIHAYCKEEKMEKAENMLEIMMQQHICPDVFTYSLLIEGLCLKGEIGRAKQLLDSMVERGLKPNIVNYNTLLNGYCKKGSVDEAWRRCAGENSWLIPLSFMLCMIN
ncbi:pentatricopeptide repeat-containing protein At1g62720-like [Salvia miltiorrhiza]|uniref:pentatricopeptide repeat-containing protein At1g62720-like n=1 Tax=Salvia miltiorrhiza TaxID=226208 RepID=UPI0025AB801F|nr:pentatricopeptide repeat-containing protein At1g62720-like [Salvia miltiorrhiza]